MDAAQGRLAEAIGEIEQLRRQQQEEHDSFEAGLHRARKEAAEGANVARQESIATLKVELTELKVRASTVLPACTAAAICFVM